MVSAALSASLFLFFSVHEGKALARCLISTWNPAHALDASKVKDTVQESHMTAAILNSVSNIPAFMSQLLHGTTLCCTQNRGLGLPPNAARFIFFPVMPETL